MKKIYFKGGKVIEKYQLELVKLSQYYKSQVVTIINSIINS